MGLLRGGSEYDAYPEPTGVRALEMGKASRDGTFFWSFQNFQGSNQTFEQPGDTTGSGYKTKGSKLKDPGWVSHDWLLAAQESLIDRWFRDFVLVHRPRM